MSIEAVFEKYLYKTKNIVIDKKEIFYVFIDLPEFWEVRADGLNGAVYNKNEKVAMIYFKEPIDLRIVDRVEWLLPTQKIYKIDYYGDYGYAYCKAYLDEGKIVSKSYFSPNHEEILQINISNGVVTVYDKGHVLDIFHSEEEFHVYCNEMLK